MLPLNLPLMVWLTCAPTAVAVPRNSKQVPATTGILEPVMPSATTSLRTLVEVNPPRLTAVPGTGLNVVLPSGAG
jgi:hypothetical protein